MTEEKIREIVRNELSKCLNNLQRATMNTKEAAAYLGISEEQLRIMSRCNEVPHVKLRSQYYYRKETLDAWMAEQEGFTPKAKIVELPIERKVVDKQKALEELMNGFKKLLEVQ